MSFPSNVIVPTESDFPEGFEDFTDAEKGAWYQNWFASRRGGGGGPDRNFGTDNPYVDDIPSIINPPSQSQQGIGSLIAGRDGNDVYRDGVLVGREGLSGDLFDYDTDGDGVSDSYLYDQYEGGKEDRSLVWQPAEEGGQGVFMYTSPETGVTIPLNPGQKIPGSGYGAEARFVPVGPDGEDYGFYDSEGRALYDEFGRDIDPVTGEQDPEMGAAIRNMDTSELDPIRQYSGTRPDKRRNINPMPEPEPEPKPEPEPPFVYTPIERDPVFPDYDRNEDGSIISPVPIQKNPFAREPTDTFGYDNMPEGFVDNSAGGPVPDVMGRVYINPKTGDKWQSTHGGSITPAEGWELFDPERDYGTFEPVVPPVNPIAPPPVSPFPPPAPPSDAEDIDSQYGNDLITTFSQPVAPPPVSPFPALPPSPFPTPVPAFQQGIGSFVPPPELPTGPSTGRTYGTMPTPPPSNQLFGG
jgi:hypothetical protein